MFESLSAVKWAKLKDTQGRSGAWIPTELKALTTNASATRREQALAKLTDALTFDGDMIDRVSVETLPFLVEALGAKQTKDASLVLALLCDLACTGSHLHFATTGWDSKRGPNPIVGKLTVAQVRAPVIAAAPAITALLDSRMPAVRATAAHLLGFLPEMQQQSAPVLTDTLKSERDPVVRANLALALGRLGVKPSKALVQRMADEKEATVALSALVARMLLGETPTPTFVSRVVSLGTPPALPFSVSPAQLARTLLEQRLKNDPASLLLLATDGQNVEKPVTVALNSLPAAKEPLRREALSAAQREVLMAIAKVAPRDRASSWPDFAVHGRAGLLGLHHLRHLAGEETPAAKAWHVAWRFIHGKASLSEWKKVVAAVGSKGVAALMADLEAFDLLNGWPPRSSYTDEESQPWVKAFRQLAVEAWSTLSEAEVERTALAGLERRGGNAALAPLVARWVTQLARRGKPIPTTVDERLGVFAIRDDFESLFDIVAQLPPERREAAITQKFIDFDECVTGKRVLFLNRWMLLPLCRTPGLLTKLIDRIVRGIDSGDAAAAIDARCIDELVAFGQPARAPLQQALKSLTKSNARARHVLFEAERRLVQG